MLSYVGGSERRKHQAYSASGKQTLPPKIQREADVISPMDTKGTMAHHGFQFYSQKVPEKTGEETEPRCICRGSSLVYHLVSYARKIKRHVPEGDQEWPGRALCLVKVTLVPLGVGRCF